MMAEDKDVIKKALDVLTVLNTAVKNFRLYPPTSASVATTIDRLHQAFLDIFASEEQILFAESGKNLLIFDRPLRQADQEKPHVASLISILTSLGLKSISLNRGLEKEEVSYLVDLMSRKPESIKNGGGLEKLLSEQNIKHIHVDQKVYVAMDKEHKILAGLNITDDQISQFFKMTHPGMDVSSQKFQDMAADPHALSQAFKTGLSQMIEQKETLSNVKLSEKLESMLSLVDKISSSFGAEDRKKISQDISRSITGINPEIAKQLSASNIEHLFGGLLIQYLMADLTNEKMAPYAPGKGNGSDGDGGGKDSEGGKAKSKLVDVAEKFGARLSDERTLMDEGLMSMLPKIIEQLIVQKEQQTLEDMLQHLVDNLKNKNSETRASAAKGLMDILDHLPADQKNDVLEHVSGKLLEWFKTETVISETYSKICILFKNVIEDSFTQKQFSRALIYTEALSSVASGLTCSPDEAKKVSAGILQEISSTENVNILADKIKSIDDQERLLAGQIFTTLGQTAINDALDQLRDTTESNTRVKLMHLITASKSKALPFVTARIRKNEPWYYLRNMAYLLGHIGNEDSVRILSTLLHHPNIKVRQEALKSIQKTGGSQKGVMMLSALPLADDEFKLSLVEALGQVKVDGAVKPLLDLLKNRPLMSSSVRISLEEKICTALGAIGSPDAIPYLSEIAESKSFLAIRSYPDKLKAAAAKALVILRRKVAESGPDNI